MTVSSATIPFHRPSIGDREKAAVMAVLDSGWLTTGERTVQFEAAISERLGVRHAVAVNSATAALHLALEALGVRPEHEVIVPAYTFAASGETVRYLGARPRIADIDARTLNLSVETIAAQVRPATRAIQVVHMGGLVADMGPIMAFAREHGLAVVEDAAHALPASRDGRQAGAWGVANALSFYATKTVTTGEGGMLTTDSDEIADRARVMRLHGISRDAWKRYSAGGNWFYEIEDVGFKYNMTDIAAALGLVQLERAEEMRLARERVANRYDEWFGQPGLADVLDLPEHAAPGDVHAWHLYPLRLRTERLGVTRDAAIESLKADGIGTSVHFIPLHLHPYYRRTYGYAAGDFPVAEREYGREISLPIYPDLTDSEIERVVAGVSRALHLAGVTTAAATVRRSRPVVLVTHSYYEEDPRVRRQAEAILAAGYPVDVISLRRPDDPSQGVVAGVSVWRLDVQRHQGAGLGTYLGEYLAFFVRVAIRLVRTQPRRRYALVQVATLPDWLVLAALPLRLAGVPVLLDLHESMPDFFRSRFPGAANPVIFRVLRLAERVSIAAATHAVTVNDALRERLIGLGVRPEQVDVVRNTPSLARFDHRAYPARAFMADGTLRLVYAGALTPTYELDVAIRAIARLGTLRPDQPIIFDVYGRGDSRPALEALAAELGLAERVVFHGRIAIEAVPAAIAAADIGLAPTRRDAFTDSSLSTKILEYAAMRRPAVASRLPLVEQTFAPGTVATYEPGDADGMAGAILRLVDDEPSRRASVSRTARLVATMTWEDDARAYLALLEGLLRPG